MESGPNGSRVPPEADEPPVASPSDHRTGPVGELLASAVRFVEELSGSIRQQIEIYADRQKLAIRRQIVRGTIAAVVGIAGLVWLCSAMLAVLRGLCAGLAVLFGGRVWAGDLVGGLIGVGLVVCAVLVATRVMARADLRRLEAKYDRPREDQGQDGRSAARAAGNRSA